MSNPLDANKQAVILEVGDIQTDGRCRNIAGTLHRLGFTVIFIGPGDENERSKLNGILIEKLAVNRRNGLKLLLVHFWFRAFWRIVTLRPALIVAEDLYSLPAAVVARFFTGSRILYDSKELYFALASLHTRPVTQRFWSVVERFCIRFVHAVITSGERDSEIISQRYRINRPVTINNHPPKREAPGDKNILRRMFNIPDNYTIFLYQGWLLQGRGLFSMIEIASGIDNIFLVIIGDGMIRKDLEKRVQEKKISHRILFTGALQYEQLLEYTHGADVGCALIEDLGMSYRHARPNKMFEYIQANIPVLVSNMPAMEEVVREWGVGIAVSPDDNNAILSAARRLIDDSEFYDQCVGNCRKAAEIFHWGEEEKKLRSLVNSLASSVD